MTLTSAQSIALTRARAYLQAAGVQWAILNEDGTTEGPLQVRVLKAKPEPVYRTSRGPRATTPNMQEKYNWHAKVDALQPSESVAIDCETEEDARHLTRNVSSRVHKSWGPENYVISVVGMRVEILRIM